MVNKKKESAHEGLNPSWVFWAFKSFLRHALDRSGESELYRQ